MPLTAGSLRPGELTEFPFRGPFGGIQSELPPDFVEKYGFADALNVIFRQGSFETRHGYELEAPLPIESPGEITGFADFWTQNGDRIQVAFTDTGLFQVESGTWTQITGTLNPSGFRMSTAVVSGKLCFAHLGTDKVQVWDGITPGFSDASADAVPAQFLMEFDNRLFACFTLEAGTTIAPQRVRWTAPGNPADWTSLAAGQVDLFNDLGPITGAVSTGQRAFIFQQRGLVVVQATGIGTNPFIFTKFLSKAKGNVCPYSLDSFGDDVIIYVGSNNVYLFDGSTINPIGDYPLDGRIRGGARARIFNDLRGVDFSKVVGHIISGCNGNVVNLYILVIRGVAIWVFSLDNYTWTRWAFDKEVSTVGTYFEARLIRIMDLIGTIAEQSWTPANINVAIPLDCIGLGFADGTVGKHGFEIPTESPWFLQSGQCAFQDFRHEKTEKKFRIISQDLQEALVTLTVENEKGQISTKDFVLGGGNTGKMQAKIISVNINGYLNSWKLSGAAQQNVRISEITPMYDTGAEVRG